MRVLFSANPMYGHINTMLPLATAAQRAGHDVAFATGAGMTAHLRRHGVTAWDAGPASAPAGSSTDWIEFFLAAAAERSPTLVSRAREWQPAIVVHDETDLAGAVVGAVNGSALHVVHGLGLMPPARLWDLFAPTIDALIESSGGDVRAATIREARYLSVSPASLQPAQDQWLWSHLLPLRHSSGPPTPSERMEVNLDALPYGTTVHLTLGTVFTDAATTLRTAIDGLRVLPANLIVTIGPGQDPDAFGVQPAHVVITRYVPHALLLPRCDMVVSQAGAGVMLGSLAHGLPQLALPQGAEQHTNAEAMARSGAGLVLDETAVTPRNVTSAARRLLEEQTFSAAAAAIAAEMAEMPEADVVLRQLIEQVETSAGH